MRGRWDRDFVIRPWTRWKSLSTSTASGADHGVPYGRRLYSSSMPRTAPRVTHVHAPGRPKSRSAIWASPVSAGASGSGTTSAPPVDPSGVTGAASAQRVSAWPPGGAGACTPPTGSPGSGLARKAIGRPTSAGATVTPTLNEPDEVAVAGPGTVQSLAPPDDGPTETVTP